MEIHRKPCLSKVVRALCSTGRLPRLLDGRDEQAREDRQDGNDDEKFYERETMERATGMTARGL
jgi:hypothetical protein